MKRVSKTRTIVITALLAAISSVLMYLNFALPFAPAYLKIDFSDFPALLASFSLNPVCGMVVCLIKNLISLPASNTQFVGEISNFILSSTFVMTAGFIYRRHKSKKSALVGCLVGAFAMSVMAVFSNYFVVYPAYVRLMFGGSEAPLIGMSSALIPWIDSILKVVLVFNFPFTLLKGIINALITFAVYKRISPIIKGNK
ncbi:MAG: ECF transporter S component [Ruminococcaceae bacterium]|nr:ECF transporter S component [Oscillospiraceae bacterium]